MYQFLTCDLCKIGMGTTHYPFGDFKHVEQDVYKYGPYDICGDCYIKHMDDPLVIIYKIMEILDEGEK